MCFTWIYYNVNISIFGNIGAQSLREATLKRMINELPNHELLFIGWGQYLAAQCNPDSKPMLSMCGVFVLCSLFT